MKNDPLVRGPLPDPGLSWSQLRAFEACARLSDFGEAAAELNLSPSAIRQQVALIESRLGVILFERRAGRLTLTPVGAAFAHDVARPMQELIRACIVAMQNSANAPATLTAPPLFARRFLYRDGFLEWCERNAVKLDITDLKRDVLAPDQIVAIRLGAKPDASLNVTPVLNIELAPAAAPMIVKQARPDDRDWWSEQLHLALEVTKPLWATVHHALGITDLMEPRWLTFSSYAAVLEAACAGRGLILAPISLVSDELRSGLLRRLVDVTVPSPYGYSLVMRRDFTNTARGRLLRRKILSEIASHRNPSDGSLKQ